MNEQPTDELAAEGAALLELGVVLGENHAFGLIAGRCSAAQAAGLRRLREEKLYKRCCEKWDDFCPRYLKMSRSEADRTIKLLDEFGPVYFELSQLTRVSAETYRAIEPAIQDGALHYEGEVIDLNPENARKIASAVAELRRTLPKASERGSLMQEIRDLGHEVHLVDRIAKLNQCCNAVIAEFEKISGDRSLPAARVLFNSALARVRTELGRVATENGVT